jgi:hypothetical protein
VASQGEEEAVAAVPEAIDPYDFADPEDFLGKMPKDFFERIVSFLGGETALNNGSLVM